MSDLHDYLERHAAVDLLRFSTAGSVDDGKSTLIGHMLHDAKGIFDDQLSALKAAGFKDDALQFALLTDGLKSEREQGITIDVAYRYFSTPERRFIIADTPGHEQYTRNMATGASTANLAVILIDARQGVLVQSRRHAFIASLLGIPHIIVAVNKMDLVDYDEAVFDAIEADFKAFAARLAFKDLSFIPISALMGDNLVEPSPKMPWYDGQPLLRRLETVYTGGDRNLIDFRFPVQLVLRPNHEFRGYAGQISSGVVRVGDEVMVLPSGKRTHIARIVTYNGDLPEAFAPQSVTLVLEDEIDLDRGDMLVHPGNLPQVRRDIDAMVVWMAEEALHPGRTYVVKHTTRSVRARVAKLRYRIDPNTLHRQDAGKLELNEIGRISLQAFKPLLCDPYEKNRNTGAFILIDPLTNATVAAGMILDRKRATDTARNDSDSRERLMGQRGTAVWLRGGTDHERAEAAAAIEASLLSAGHPALALTEQSTPSAAVLLCRAGLIAVLAHGEPDATVPADRLITVHLGRGEGEREGLRMLSPMEAPAIVRALERQGIFKV